MNIKDFIDHIITFNNVDDILDNCKTQSEKGFIFERLFDIVIKFGFCEIFTNSNFNHLSGNSNNARLKILENINQYLNEKVLSGNSSGCSDITLQNKNDDTYIFISSKYPKSNEDIKKQKSVDYYDIQNIIAMATKNKHIYKNYKIYLVVPNKKKVLDKVKNANESSEYITEHMTEENILDKDDLNKYFLAFKQDIIKNKNKKKDLQTVYLSSKENLILRFHQELITQKTSNLIEEGNKSFLWGCKCRSGKTYMIGGIINKQYDIKNKLNVLIITPAPTETSPQFTNDLFNKFKDFDKFKIHHIEGSKNIDSFELSSNNIFVMSKQLLQKYINEKTIMKIKNLKLDIIAFDENHFSGTTNLSKDILDSYSSKNTVKIYLTATYSKPLQEWNILPECQMFWDIEDEQICKSILIDVNNLIRLKEKHGNEYITSTIKNYTDLGLSMNNIFKSYDKMPDLHLITNMFDQQRYEIIKENIMGSHYGFSFDVLFSLNKDRKFNYKNEIKTILRYISGSEKEQDYKTCDKSIFTRIDNICSRTPFTQIWFLPSDNINFISQNLKLLMLEDKILKNYNMMCINRQNNDLAKDIKDEILKQEIITKSEGKKGLILLAGNMLSLGITINSCDIVMLMNNTLSSDKVMQQMYRCMTEGNNKKMGFVVDLNISRVLQTCINYTVYKNSKSVEDKIKYLIENHLINIDIDMMHSKKLNSDGIIKKLMDIWKGDPINSFKTLLRNLDNDYIIFDNPMQKLLNASFTNSLKDNKVNSTVKLKDDELQELPSGKKKIKDSASDSDDNSSQDNEEEKEKEKEIKISFTKDVLPYVIPLTCILTIENKNKDFIHMLNDIKKSNELLEIFDDQCLIWWNKKGLIDIIHDIINKYFDKSSNTYNISIQFKMSIQSLLDRPKELLELISDCLKPKAIEKKTFGEVFTPMDFINNKMLKDIEDYWLKNKNENIWTNEKITWYDPATGMGNYPIAIYYKLMEGLKNKIANEIERKKHIIEKQLYMGELNKKNCFVIKQIFNINNEYNLNLYEGDTLNIKINEVFGKTKFDIIIGNPPYNEELTSVGAKPLYNKFIEYYVNKCNLLSFIVPSRWFAGGKGLDKFREMMINRTDILYIKHYENACQIFGNTISIEGGVNYFLIDKDYNGLCDYNGTKVKFNNFDIILDGKYYNIVNKILNFDKITKYYISQDYYKIQTNDSRLKDTKTDNDIKCYVSQQKGFTKYIDKTEIKKSINNYKVITARANGGNGCFGNTFIGNSNEVHTKSYISFNLNSENEAKSLLSYMTCKLPNFMLNLRKISQDISETTCKWIPLPPLNKEWNDEDVYKYFQLSKDEIKLIKETKISGYNDIKLTDENEPKKVINKIRIKKSNNNEI
ncbi:putative site-specific DNA-methyltransferase [Bodo saltans virus]|uniref:Site-specific DNA-methyltransferase n=1 Tax=Bodo saltans virus TaxID=2024608 RepID=A0A2H4UUH6_9VIRU|nr:putative site-specific DNA-methyltransferase [Bodo saltans virus]ATZ80507.1 putative site-specific DNA-methyltransferase [Bodo saltans virus]